MTPDRQLIDLVQSRRAELRLSYSELAEAAVDPETGDCLSRAWLHRLETGLPVIPPALPQLRALAIGMQVPLTRVQWAAAGQYFGLHEAPVNVEAAEIASLAAQLTAGQRDALYGFLDALVAGK